MSLVTKARPRSELPKRPFNRELAPGLFEPVHVIDIDAPAGRYAIDAMAHELFGAFSAEPVREARIIVDIVGRSAHRWAAQDNDAGAAHKAAAVFDSNLELLVDRCEALQRTDIDRFCGIFDDDSAIDPEDLESSADRAEDQARAADEIIADAARSK